MKYWNVILSESESEVIIEIYSSIMKKNIDGFYLEIDKYFAQVKQTHHDVTVLAMLETNKKKKNHTSSIIVSEAVFLDIFFNILLKKENISTNSKENNTEKSLEKKCTSETDKEIIFDDLYFLKNYELRLIVRRSDDPIFNSSDDILFR